jgi:RNA polymerase sigma-70 factor (family 1)
MSTLIDKSDEVLITKLVASDSCAFEMIYKKYATELYSYARRNIQKREDAEEIIQDVFEYLWINREKMGKAIWLRAYLYQMVRYKIIRYFTHKKVIQKYADHYLTFESLYDLIPEFDKNEKSLQSLVLERIVTLPDRCQQAFKLRMLENLSNSEIAERMEISKSTVENYMVNAFKHLRSFAMDSFKLS